MSVLPLSDTGSQAAGSLNLVTRPVHGMVRAMRKPRFDADP